MIYETRHLVALREFAHFDRSISPGDPFSCDPIDADYYVTRGLAKPDTTKGEAPVAQAAQAAIAAQSTTNRRGRRLVSTVPVATPKATGKPAEQAVAVAEGDRGGAVVETGFVSAADAGTPQ